MIQWPICTLMPRDIAANVVPRTIGGPPALSGYNQSVASDTGAWVITYTGIPLTNRERILTFRAIDALADGRLNPILVSAWDKDRPPYGIVGPLDPLPHSDDSFFSDGTGYETARIEAYVQQAAALNATTVRIRKIGQPEMQPGQRFSIGYRLYQIRRVTHFGWQDWDVQIRPWLREAVDADTWVEFNRPVCKMRLATDSEMNLDLMGSMRASPAVTFIEDPN